jgi:cytochrome c oxidase subunit 3
MNEIRRFHLAVWIVIASEALLFSGLFMLYWAYRAEYTSAFRTGVEHDIGWIGALNTFLLLSSSFTIAYAIHAMRFARVRTAMWCLLATLAMGAGFLVFKLLEWGLHIQEGIVPGIRYYAGPAGGRGISLFFTLYYFMTGLHALHVIAGIGLVLWVTVRVRRRTIIPERFIALELVALYWHFVDVVWVFLWPMFYLMR